MLLWTVPISKTSFQLHTTYLSLSSTLFSVIASKFSSNDWYPISFLLLRRKLRFLLLWAIQTATSTSLFSPPFVVRLVKRDDQVRSNAICAAPASARDILMTSLNCDVASLSKWGLAHNHSYEWLKSHFHMKRWAPRLALRKRLKVIWKWLLWCSKMGQVSIPVPNNSCILDYELTKSPRNFSESKSNILFLDTCGLFCTIGSHI